MKNHANSTRNFLPVIAAVTLMLLLGIFLRSMPIQAADRPSGSATIIDVSNPTIGGVSGVYTVDPTEKLIFITGNPQNNGYISLTGEAIDGGYTVAVAENAGTAADPIWIVLSGVNITSTTASPLHLQDGANVVLDLEQNSENSMMTTTDMSQPITSVSAGIWIDGADVKIDAPEPDSGASMGTLTTQGGTGAAGIGGQKPQATAINLTIENGEINAAGGFSAAGIGGGFKHSKKTNVTINGGKVVAVGGNGLYERYGGETHSGGAGIGSGLENLVGSTHIKIAGGIIEATGGAANERGGDSAAGIGAGPFQKNDLLIDITGGNITATAGLGGSSAAIGGSAQKGGYNALTINIGGDDTVVKASASEQGGCGIGSGKMPGAGETGATNINITGGDITATGPLMSSGDLGSGIGIAGQLSMGVILNINITGGKINASGSKFSAGIGTSDFPLGKLSIFIEGGEIIATGGENAPGIGSGALPQDTYATGFDTAILIKGGTICATGGKEAAGIGGGKNGGVTTAQANPPKQPLTIQIENGNITAIGGEGGAGIGAGADTASEQVDDSNPGDPYTKIVTIKLSGGDIYAVAGAKRNFPLSRVPDAIGSGDCIDLQMAISLGQYLNLLAVSQGDGTKETRAIGIPNLPSNVSAGYIVEGSLLTPATEPRTLEVWDKFQEKQQGGLLPAGYRDVAMVVNSRNASDLWLELLNAPTQPEEPVFLGWLRKADDDAMKVTSALTNDRKARSPIDLVLAEQVKLKTWTVDDNIPDVNRTTARVEGELQNHRGTQTSATLTYWETADLDSKISKEISVTAEGTFSIDLSSLQEGRSYTVTIDATLVPGRRLVNPGNLEITTLGDTAITITFDPTGGQWFDESSEPRARSVNPNTPVTAPTPNPTKKQHAFQGWFTAEIDGEKWDFSTALDPANGNSLRLFAQWEWTETLTVNVKFVLEEAEVDRRTTITEPTPPPKANHTFIGWFTAPEGGEKWDFSTLVDPEEAEMALFARWEKNTGVTEPPQTVTVTFHPNGGTWNGSSAPKVINTHVKGDPITAPETPTTPSGPSRTFAGWYRQIAPSANDTPWDFSTPISTGMALYAQWENGPLITVTVNKLDGTTVTLTTDRFGRIREPQRPTSAPEGYDANKFLGWFRIALRSQRSKAVETEEEPWDFNTLVIEPMTLEPRWAPLLNSETGSTPVSSTPVSSTPVSSTPVSSTPVSSTPVGSTPTSSRPVTLPPVIVPPVGSTPVGSTPVSSAPASSTPASSTPASSTPVSSAPVGSSPTSSDGGKVLPDGDRSDETFSPSGGTGNNGSEPPTTGDTTFPLLIVLFATIFAAAMIVTWKQRRKIEQDET